MLRFWLVFCGICLLPQMAQTASFDCTKANHPVEHAICGNDDLSQLDDDMTALFRERRGFIIKGDTILLRSKKNGCAICGKNTRKRRDLTNM